MIPRKPTHKGFKPRTKGLNPRGKSNRAKNRTAWQREMVATYAHITRCEWPTCPDTLGLAHAHSKKKTKITTREEWLDVAKLCQHHHDWVEYGDKENPGTHERMFDLIHWVQKVSAYR